jgi:hypothetical protein
MAEANAMSTPPTPHSIMDDAAPTKPMAANTRCPVNSNSINDENIIRAIIS